MADEPESPPVSEQPTLDRAARHAADSFGRYRLLQRLGEGGMGEVWLAEQTEPVRRQVAIKVIKAGMDSTQVLARFEAERQALALMDHAAIATVLDGGTTPQGRPYFAMEFVKGEAITTYCDRHRLSTRQRLELFTQVCEGVQHAHQKGIIHRDLKPSNVLVTIQDERPLPKIIDFGVAKATARQLTERTLFTELGAMIGTPEYMSPEQAEMSGLDIDTRTDIYALGVLLYELLTGALPFERKELRQAGLAEIQRIIREKDPPRPSMRVAPGPASEEAARNRGTEPRRLRGELRGDLDWITMRALEKDRTQRYQTASALAADLRRHLANEPVSAGPPSVGYRAGKFVRRHRFGVVAAGCLVLLLVAFAVAMAIQARRIAQERNRANREAEAARSVSRFLVSLFEVARPSEKAADSLTAREILSNGADRIDTELGAEPEVRAALLTTMADVYFSLGQAGRSGELNEKALTIRRELHGPRHPDVAASQSAVAATRPDLVEAERLLRDTLALQRGLDGVTRDDLTSTLVRLSTALRAQGKYNDAEPFAREALDRATSDYTRPEPILVRAWGELGSVRFGQADYRDAERCLRAALAASTALYGPRHFQTLGKQQNVASVQMLQGRYAEAEATYREIVRVGMPLAGPSHPDIGIQFGNLGVALYFQKKYAEAEVYYRKALDIARQEHGIRHEGTAVALVNLGQALDAQGKVKEAGDVLDQAVTVQRDLLGPDSPILATGLTSLSEALRHAGRWNEAEALAREALSINVKHLGKDHPETLQAEGALGRALAKQRRWAEAEPLLLRYGKALEVNANIARDFGEVALEIAGVYQALNRAGEAQRWRARAASAPQVNDEQ